MVNYSVRDYRPGGSDKICEHVHKLIRLMGKAILSLLQG